MILPRLDQAPAGASLEHHWPVVEGRVLARQAPTPALPPRLGWMVLTVVLAGAVGSRLGSRHRPVA